MMRTNADTRRKSIIVPQSSIEMLAVDASDIEGVGSVEILFISISIVKTYLQNGTEH